MGNELSRRAFVGVALAGVVAGCGSVARLNGSVADGRVVIPRSALVGGEPTLVSLPEPHDGVILIPGEDGEINALSSRCTHLGCALRPSARFLQCPCHASTFDLDGNALRGPAQKPLTRFKVEATDDAIEIVLIS